MLCRNAWMPPGRGGKSLVTIKVLSIAADSTGRPCSPAVGGTGGPPGAGPGCPATPRGIPGPVLWLPHSGGGHHGTSYDGRNG